jgi:hypothetical protein
MSSRPDLGPRPQLCFAGSRIERAAELRADVAALVALRQAPESRCYLIGGAWVEQGIELG